VEIKDSAISSEGEIASLAVCGVSKHRRIIVIRRFRHRAVQMKVNILPMAITGLETSNHNPFNRKPVKVELGDVISYDQSYDEIIDEWCTKISQMTGYEYVKPEVGETVSAK